MIEGVRAGQRRALAKTITLLESRRADHQQQAQQLLEALLPQAGNALRIGISGVPGVGKSTFIEAFGMLLLGAGHRVAVLAVDPSSGRSGGSIMGDKTRMERLAADPRAFIRPSPSGGTLGGVARRTREAMVACEAAGFDVILVETVGVGQSEVAVASMTDVFVLLMLPTAGDELQGIKRGIMELADVVVINKADLHPKEANRAQSDYGNALRLLTPHGAAWKPRVLQASALSGQGLAQVWDTLLEYRSSLGTALMDKRARQTLEWFDTLLREEVWNAFVRQERTRALLPDLRERVRAGEISPSSAAALLLGERVPR
nr:methylmalonyl Co-A mutase-associated GTPase MeaB [Deinobacterium chartae]